MPRGPQDSQGLRTTRWPTSRVRDGRTHLDHIGHHFVPEDRGKGEEPVQRAIVVKSSPKSMKTMLGVGAADAGQSRLGHTPVVAQQRGRSKLLETHRCAGQPAHEVLDPSGGVQRSPRTP
jgi:hypothetical protein